MLLEILAASALAVAGTVGLVLWVDHRAALERTAVATLTGLVIGTVAAVAIALRVTALGFTFGAVGGVLIALAGWTLVVRLTTRPPTAEPVVDDPALRAR